MALLSPKSCWMSNEAFRGWTENIFLPHINNTQQNPDEPVLLVVGSRAQPEVMELFASNKVHVLVIPAHTSHLLQPLDLGINRVFKEQLAKYCREDESGEEPLAVLRFKLFQHAKAAFYDASNERHILTAWRKSGISPYDPSVVLDDPTRVNTLPPPEKPKRDAVKISGCFATSPEKVTQLRDQSILREQKREAKKSKQAQKLKGKTSISRPPKIKITKATKKKFKK